MSRLVAGLAAGVLLAAAAPAPAQVNRNVIRDSGNGANNTIVARNGPGRAPIQLIAPPAPAYQPPVYQQPVQPVDYQPQYQAGYAPQYAPPAGGFGGGGLLFNRNRIVGSGNGVGNVIRAVNRGGSGYDPAAPFPYGMGGFGVNVNVITNSGNGAGNTINTVNKSFGGPGGININVVTNSGNGVGNVIGARNR